VAATQHDDGDDNNRELWSAAANYSYLGIFFGVALVIGVWSGMWLDHRLHTKPWFMVVGMFLGIAGGFTELVRVARLLKRRADRAEQRKKKEGKAT